MEIQELCVKNVCKKCKKESDRIGYYCSSCLQKKNKYERETAAFCRENKICPVCRKEKLYGKERHCPICRAKNTERKYKYRNTIIDKDREYKKTIYYKNKNKREQNNLCTRCGKEKHDMRYKLCAMCRYKICEYRKSL